MIEGVMLRAIDQKTDARGSFAEVFSDRWELPITPRQWSLVRSTAGTLRGMHLHLRHDEWLLPISGHCVVGLHDLRPDSPSSGRSMLIELDANAPQSLCFPRGIVHGWYFPTDCMHLQAVSEPYSEYSEDDNFGCHYGDPELAIPWPARPHIVSERARMFPNLTALRAQLQTMWSR
ncbi:MAG: dTDP-4-dehydrorhamnose 3,5-epimerase family protein [Pseudomarimonas sp.]